MHVEGICEDSFIMNFTCLQFCIGISLQFSGNYVTQFVCSKTMNKLNEWLLAIYMLAVCVCARACVCVCSYMQSYINVFC